MIGCAGIAEQMGNTPKLAMSAPPPIPTGYSPQGHVSTTVRRHDFLIAAPKSESNLCFIRLMSRCPGQFFCFSRSFRSCSRVRLALFAFVFPQVLGRLIFVIPYWKRAYVSPIRRKLGSFCIIVLFRVCLFRISNPRFHGDEFTPAKAGVLRASGYSRPGGRLIRWG